MNLWLRLLRVVLTARRRGPVTPLEPGSIRVRVWPHDLDLWGHVNGGRSLYDPVGPRTPRSVHSQRLDGLARATVGCCQLGRPWSVSAVRYDSSRPATRNRGSRGCSWTYRTCRSQPRCGVLYLRSLRISSPACRCRRFMSVLAAEPLFRGKSDSRKATCVLRP